MLFFCGSYVIVAVERGASSSTQNQALNALVFVYRPLDKNLEENELKAVRAIRKSRLPFVLKDVQLSPSGLMRELSLCRVADDFLRPCSKDGLYVGGTYIEVRSLGINISNG